MRGRPAECARGSRAWALLLLGIVLLTSPVSAQPVEQDKVAGAVPAEPSPPRENDLPGKPAPPAKVAECVATAGDWQEPERWAWQQICARQPIDFNKRYGTLKPAPAPDALAAETRRHLGADFLREIFEDPTYATHTQNAPIHIAGAYLKNVAIGDTTLGPSGHRVVCVNGAVATLGEMPEPTLINRSRSSGRPSPCDMRYSTFSIQPVPSRHGVHLPHDSCA